MSSPSSPGNSPFKELVEKSHNDLLEIITRPEAQGRPTRELPIEVVHERIGHGEDARTKIRERFRQVTDGLLRRFQNKVLNGETSEEEYKELLDIMDKLFDARDEYIGASAALRP